MASVLDSLERALIECVASVKRREQATGGIAQLHPDDTAMAALKACIGDYARLERATGALPEQVLVRLKQVLPSINPSSDHEAQLRGWAVRWCIAAYFDE